MRFYGNSVLGKPVSSATSNTILIGQCTSGKTNLAIQLALDDFYAGNQVIYLVANSGIETLIKQIPAPVQNHLILIDGHKTDILQLSLTDLTGHFTFIILPHKFQRTGYSNFLPYIEHFLAFTTKTNSNHSIWIDPFDVNQGFESWCERPLFQKTLTLPNIALNIVMHGLANIKNTPTWSILKKHVSNTVIFKQGFLPRDFDLLDRFLNASLTYQDLYLDDFQGQVIVGKQKPLLVLFPHLEMYSRYKTNPVQDKILTEQMLTKNPASNYQNYSNELKLSTS